MPYGRITIVRPQGMAVPLVPAVCGSGAVDRPSLDELTERISS